MEQFLFDRKTAVMPKAYKINPLLLASKPKTGGDFLFDWNTAPRHNTLIYKIFLIALNVSGALAPSKLFPFQKQLEQSGSLIQIENC